MSTLRLFLLQVFLLQQSILAYRTILFLKRFLPCMRTSLLCKEVIPQGIEFGNTPILILYLHYQASMKQHVIRFENN